MQLEWSHALTKWAESLNIKEVESEIVVAGLKSTENWLTAFGQDELLKKTEAEELQKIETMSTLPITQNYGDNNEKFCKYSWDFQISRI